MVDMVGSTLQSGDRQLLARILNSCWDLPTAVGHAPTAVTGPHHNWGPWAGGLADCNGLLPNPNPPTHTHTHTHTHVRVCMFQLHAHPRFASLSPSPADMGVPLLVTSHARTAQRSSRGQGPAPSGGGRGTLRGTPSHRPQQRLVALLIHVPQVSLCRGPR